MGIFTRILGFLGGDASDAIGNLGGKVVDAISARFPKKMSEAEKAEMALIVQQSTRTFELELLKLANDSQTQFDKRVSDMEGTAKDLAGFGFLGRIMLFLRGSQRIAWGFGTLYWDIMVFTQRWSLIMTKEGTDHVINLEPVFYLVNLLVLGFLFGERTVVNILPLVNEFLKLKNGKGGHNVPGV